MRGVDETNLRLQGCIFCGGDDGLRGRLYGDHRGRRRSKGRGLLGVGTSILVSGPFILLTMDLICNSRHEIEQGEDDAHFNPC